MKPNPGYAALRRYRWSAAGAEYFVTIKARRPAEGLTRGTVLTALNRERDALEAAGHWQIRTWVVMPDHVHLLFRLGDDASLTDCVRQFKGRISPVLRRENLHWQDGFFEHRLRADEDRQPVFRYIFLNPYRAELLSLAKHWSGYYCAADDWVWFQPLTDSGVPFPEWLAV